MKIIEFKTTEEYRTWINRNVARKIVNVSQGSDGEYLVTYVPRMSSVAVAFIVVACVALALIALNQWVTNDLKHRGAIERKADRALVEYYRARGGPYTPPASRTVQLVHDGVVWNGAVLPIGTKLHFIKMENGYIYVERDGQIFWISEWVTDVQERLGRK